MFKLNLLLCLLLCTTTEIFAQTFKANIDSLSFMSGKWFQQHKWGDMEEFWGKPMGNNMVSSYRCVKDGKILFYEFVVIEQTDSVPVMMLRHFNAGSIGWEEKDKPERYPLISLENKMAVFQSINKTITLSYHRISDNKMDIILNEKNKQGITETTTFNYTLQTD